MVTCLGSRSCCRFCCTYRFILGTTFVELERKQPLPILYTSPLILISWSITCLSLMIETMLLYRIQIPTSASQLLCPGEILLMCEEIKSIISSCHVNSLLNNSSLTYLISDTVLVLLIQRSVWAVFSTCGNSITWVPRADGINSIRSMMQILVINTGASRAELRRS
ncbi:hypothetical protein NC652_022091 [Populus alba x Populus x berolinensis]|nr:hypothetical protein NC652_022091 [Populus alba x Populus x berolinensis]